MRLKGLHRYDRIIGPVLLAALRFVAARSVEALDFVVTKVADTAGSCEITDCSLREAILAANAISGLDQITVPAGGYILAISGSNEDVG